MLKNKQYETNMILFFKIINIPTILIKASLLLQVNLNLTICHVRKALMKFIQVVKKLDGRL